MSSNSSIREKAGINQAAKWLRDVSARTVNASGSNTLILVIVTAIGVEISVVANNGVDELRKRVVQLCNIRALRFLEALARLLFEDHEDGGDFSLRVNRPDRPAGHVSHTFGLKRETG